MLLTLPIAFRPVWPNPVGASVRFAFWALRDKAAQRQSA